MSKRTRLDRVVNWVMVLWVVATLFLLGAAFAGNQDSNSEGPRESANLQWVA